MPAHLAAVTEISRSGLRVAFSNPLSGGVGFALFPQIRDQAVWASSCFLKSDRMKIKAFIFSRESFGSMARTVCKAACR